MAMDLADSETVLGNFDNVTLTHFGITSRFYRSEGKYMVNTEGPGREDDRLRDCICFRGAGLSNNTSLHFPEEGTSAFPSAGIHDRPMQGGQRWFHIYQDERIPPDDVLFWTRVTQNWNYMCAECHSTNLHKNYSYEEKAYHTTWSEIDVSCEACHGPGSEHIDWAEKVEAGSSPDISPNMGLVVRLKDTDNATWIFDPDSVTARRSVPRQSDELVQMCSRCHARRAVATEDYYHGGSLLDTHWPSLLEEGSLFCRWTDPGRGLCVWIISCRARCTRQVWFARTVMNPTAGRSMCRGMHSATAVTWQPNMVAGNTISMILPKQGPAVLNATCMNAPIWWWIPVATTASASHRPDLSDKLGTPNACNQCHNDKSTQWATRYLKEWYGEDLLNQHALWGDLLGRTSALPGSP